MHTQASYQQAGEYPVTGPQAQDSRSFEEQTADQVTRKNNETRNKEGHREGREDAVHHHAKDALTEITTDSHSLLQYMYDFAHKRMQILSVRNTDVHSHTYTYIHTWILQKYIQKYCISNLALL